MTEILLVSSMGARGSESFKKICGKQKKCRTMNSATEPVFVDLLRSPGNDFQPGGIDSWAS
jgi:hypothetical protein